MRVQSVVTGHIELTPGVCGGKPCIAGHRIRVVDVAVWHEQCGWSADEIVAHFPQLTLGEVHAALAYYFDHHAEIRGDLERAKFDEAAARKRHPSKLKRNLGVRRDEVLARRAHSRRGR